MSWLLGRLAAIPLPRPFNELLIGIFCRSYGVRVDEAERPVSTYPSIGAFFTRSLKPGLRPIAEGIVSPVDGALRTSGPIESGRLEQIKGKDYSAAELLKDEEAARTFEGGQYFNLYLSPPDYHHVHSPVDGVIERVVHLPGTLWPVNEWSVRNITNLFGVNERVIVYIRSDRGLVAVVFVGAMNVGKISLSFHPLIANDVFGRRRVRDEPISPPRPVKKGERLGTFHLGSTVVLLFTESAGVRELPRSGSGVRLGEGIAE